MLVAGQLRKWASSIVGGDELTAKATPRVRVKREAGLLRSAMAELYREEAYSPAASPSSAKPCYGTAGEPVPFVQILGKPVERIMLLTSEGSQCHNSRQ